jgi:MFS family permease
MWAAYCLKQENSGEKVSTSSSAASEWRGYWFLPLAAALGYATSVLHVYSFSSFVAPLQAEFGWSRAEISLGLTVSNLGSGLLCIPVGLLVDRIGPRGLGLLGVLLMSCAFALLGTATGELSNWLALWGVVAVGTFLVQGTVWTAAVASRFEASRGFAFGITLCGASVAAAVFPKIATYLIDAQGWRSAFATMGGAWALLALPILFFGFRGAQDGGRQQRAAAREASKAMPGLTIMQGLRSAALYKLLIAGGIFAFTMIGAVAHFIPILTDTGTTPQTAASIAGLVGIFSIIGRFGTGALLDRFPGHVVGALAFLIPIAACALLMFDGGNATSQMAAAAIIGLTLGAEVDVVAYLAAKHFGLRNFGALYGAQIMALAVGAAAGPLAAGAVFDQYGDYKPFLLLVAVLTGLSAIVLYSLGPAPKAHAVPG